MNDYPFELWVYGVTSSGLEDSYGFETPPTGVWVKHSACYEQVMGAMVYYMVRNGKNGESFSYSSVIFLPPDVAEVVAGTGIQVRQDGAVRFEGVSKRFSRDVEHCRIWS